MSTNNETNPPANTITVAEAMNWIDVWRNMYKIKRDSDGKHYDVRSFHLPLGDFQNLLSEPGVAGIRFYLATDPVNIADEAGGIKILAVGVDSSGNDLVSGANNHIYDLSHPCPKICDVNSPLYGGSANNN